MRGRPPLGMGRSTGKSGASSAHSASLTNGLLMPAIYHTACRFVRRNKLMSLLKNGDMQVVWYSRLS